MADQLVILIVIVGIMLLGLAFKVASRLIWLGMLAFLVVLMLSRSLPDSRNAPMASSRSEPPSAYSSDASRSDSPPRSSAEPAIDALPGLIQFALNRIDEFVYGDPYAAPQSSQPAAAPQPAQSPEQPKYQIRPDGVPSRVSTFVEPSAVEPSADPARPTATRRPVSAWW